MCFTEIKLVEQQGQIYRGRPAYHGEDPWHDWVNVSWKNDDGSFSKVPAEIQFFVDIKEELFPFASKIPSYRGEGTYALVQSMVDEPKPHGYSMLLSTGVREKDQYHFQRVDTFVEPAFVVDNIGCPQQSLLVLSPRREWAGYFL
jgi:hypothetical protein